MDAYDENMLGQLERELPALSRLRRFATGLENIGWFCHLGEALTPATRQVAEGYLGQLGFPEAQIAILADWDDAANAAETLDWANAAWEAEELARAELTGRALAFMSEEALQLGLAMVTEQAGSAAKNYLLDTAALWDMVDESIHNLSVGSAVQTAYSAGLALLAAAVDPDFEAEEHIFALKLKLFAAGRWPVGVVGQSFNIF